VEGLFPLGVWELTALCAAVFFFVLAGVWALLGGMRGPSDSASSASTQSTQSYATTSSARSFSGLAPSSVVNIIPSTIPASDEIRQLFTHLRYFLLTEGNFVSAVLETQQRCSITAESIFRQYNYRAVLPAGRNQDVLRHALSMRALCLEYDAAMIELTMETARENQNRLHALLNAYRIHWEAVSGRDLPDNMAYSKPDGEWMPASPHPEISRNMIILQFAALVSSKGKRSTAWNWFVEHYHLPARPTQFPRDRERIDILMTDAACYDRLVQAGAFKGPMGAVKALRARFGSSLA
jgi:hypothetical protein